MSQQCFDTIPKTLSEERPSLHQALKAIGGGWRFLLVVLVCVLALAPKSGHASPAAAPLSSYAFTVNTSADTHDAHPGDGVCADKNGKCSLRAATEEVDALPKGSSITITMPQGTCILTLGTLNLKGQRNVTINGAGRTSTIIKGNHKFTILSISPEMSAQLAQITFEGGRAPNNGDGGGIINAGTLIMNDSTLSGNSAMSGGGIYNRGKLNVSNSTINDNSAHNGGGIYNNYFGRLSVSNSVFSGNSASYSGGGIINSGKLNVINSTLSNNTAAYGGGMENTSSGWLSLSNSMLKSNSANQGGGIYNAGGRLILTHSTLSNNTAGEGGPGYGGGIINSGTLTVTHSTLSGNSSKGDGGGIYNYGGGTLSVKNSTLSGNLAPNGIGGGIENYFNGGPVSVSNSTLSGNSATNGGDIINNSGSTVTLTGTIVANSPKGSNCVGKMKEGVGYNLDSGSSCGFSLKTDLNNTDPMLGPLGDNGGPTQTMALLQGSKAIDWVAVSSCTDTDQRGDERPDGSGESTCDIGAYESAY